MPRRTENDIHTHQKERMSAREQETNRESGKSASKNIESAFAKMVQRWLVKGANDKWQLPVAAEKKEVGSVEQGSECRKRWLDQPKRPGKKAKVGWTREKHVEAMTHDTRRKAVVKTTESYPGAPRLAVRAASLPSATALKYEHPLLRNRKSPERKIKEQRTTADCAPSTEPPGRFLMLNSATTTRRDKHVALLSTSPNRIGTKITRVHVEVNASHATGSGSEKDPSNVKQEVWTMSPRNISTCTSTTEDSMLTGKVSFNGIAALCNGQRKCGTEGCYKPALQHDLCPEHGGREKYRSERCKNYTHQVLCQAHLGGTKGENVSRERKSGSSKAGGTGRPAKSLGANLAKPRTTKSKLQNDPPSISTTRNRTNLRTKKLSKSFAPDAWQASELPSLFRSAGKRTEQVVKSLENERPECTNGKICSTAPPATNTRKPANSKDNGICKVRCCKQVEVSEGFCKTHVRCKRCRKEGCNNIAAVRTWGFCWHHAPVKECGEVGCTTKARQRGRCAKHGGKRYCREEGCVKVAYKQGLCNAHWHQREDPDTPIRTRTTKRG